MAVYYGMFDDIRKYAAAEFARVFQSLSTSGVAQGIGNALAPVAGPGLGTTIDTGLALLQGYYYYQDGTAYVSQPAVSTVGNSRIDRIIVRLTVSAKTVAIVRLPGVEAVAASAIAPALTNTSDIYEISLCQSRVNQGATVPIVTNERVFAGSILADHGHTGVAGDGGAFVYGSGVASASSITLPTSGKRIIISGTTKINTITAAPAGREVTLEFSSAGCRVGSAPDGSGGNLYLHGPYSSLVIGTLSLYSNGTTWQEIGRSRWRAPLIQLERTTALALASGYNPIPFNVENEDNYGIFTPPASTVTITAETAGLWLILPQTTAQPGAGGQRSGILSINGALFVFGAVVSTAAVSGLAVGGKLSRLSAGGTVIVNAYSDIVAQLDYARLEMRWLEP